MDKSLMSWHSFILQQSLLGNLPTVTSSNNSFIAPLNSLGLIDITGKDAEKFLHSQLTNDVQGLSREEVQISGYCSHKGRMIATLLVWKTCSGILLELPCSLLSIVQQRLEKFSMRAEVKILDKSKMQPVFGLAGNESTAILRSWFQILPSNPYGKVENQYGTLIRLMDIETIPRYQWITNEDQAMCIWSKISRVLKPVSEEVWRLTEIQACIPQVTLLTKEKFVPQMINFELIGGISFKKGCYPGQEVIARNQYLGQPDRRRTVIASINTTGVEPATEVFSSSDPIQPCGMIVNSENSSECSSLCLLEVKTKALEKGAVHLGSSSGLKLSFQKLPYSIFYKQ
jgi:hypothetical protein